MNKIIILVGIPASGKSTLAKQLQQQCEDSVVISKDNIREQYSIQWGQQQDFVSKQENQLLMNAINENKKVIIIDDSNLKKETRDKLKQIATQHGYETETIFMNTKLDEFIKRNKQRDKHIPTESLITAQQMLEQD